MVYKNDAHSSVENIMYDDVSLSDVGEVWEIRKVWMPKAKSWSKLYDDILEPFNFDNYLYPRLPIDLGPTDMGVVAQCPRVLRCTIKPVGTLKVSLPVELLPMKPVLERLLEYEYMINPGLENFEAHLTLDHGVVPAGHTQRFPGFHGDGLQGGKFKEKLVCEHSYISSTGKGTEVCLQPFFLKHLDEDIYNIFKTFDQQAEEVNVYGTIPGHVYLMDPYVVHRTPLFEVETVRSFFRLTIANNELPIEYNTLNPMLGQEKYEFKLDIRDYLQPPDVPIPYSIHGLSEPDESVDKVQYEQDVGVFEDTVLVEGDVYIFEPKKFPIVQPCSPTYKDINELFNPNKYTTVRPPIDLGYTDVGAIRECPNVLRMMLKWYDDDTVRIPKNFAPITSLLERLLTYDQNVNNFWFESAVHLTIDSRMIPPGSTHRFPGFHGDDLQGGAFPRKVRCAHSYILTTHPGTEVCLQPFFITHLDDTFEKLFDEFDKQFVEENVYRLKPGHMYLTDPYSVHRTPNIGEEVLRTFFRLTISPKELLLPHNTLNPMFSEEESTYVGYAAPHLDETRFTVTPDVAVPYEMYGVVKR